MVRFKKLVGFVDGEMMVCGETEACPLFENNKRVDGIRKNADGVPLWVVPCLYRCDGRMPEIVKVKVAAPENPEIAIGAKVSNQLRVVAWVNGSHVGYSVFADVKAFTTSSN